MTSDAARELERSLRALPAGAIRVGAAARALGSRPARELVPILESILARAARRHPDAVAASSALASALGPGQLPNEFRRELRVEAEGQGAAAVVALLSDRGPSASEPPPPPDDDLTLGHRITHARLGDPERMAGLAARAEPAVVRNLLDNPRATEALVLRIATRRPVPSETLLVIARNERFGTRRLVCRALVRNPHFPVGEALRLLPRLMAADLRELAADGGVHRQVRDGAAALLGARSR